MFHGDASLLLKYRDKVLRNLGRLSYDMKIVKIILESKELEKSIATSKAIMKEAMRNQGGSSNGYNNNAMMTPPNSLHSV